MVRYAELSLARVARGAGDGFDPRARLDRAYRASDAAVILARRQAGARRAAEARAAAPRGTGRPSR